MRLIVVALSGAFIGFLAGVRMPGTNCTYPSLEQMRAIATEVLHGLPPLIDQAQHTLSRLAPRLPGEGGNLMPSDLSPWVSWLGPAALALAALGYWLWMRDRHPPAAPAPVVIERNASPERDVSGDGEWGREFKKAFGSAGIKSIVREGRMEDAYGIRTASDTAFEAYADFDTQQERVALNSRLPGPPYLKLSDTLDIRSPLREGMGNRPPCDVWALREEWMPPLHSFVEQAASRLRASGVWPSRITVHLSSQGHGLPGLYALFRGAHEFPRADRHATFIVPEGDVERAEAIHLLDSLRHAELSNGAGAEEMPWKDARPLALTTLIRDNAQGRGGLDEVAAHIGPALTARVRFETGSSENMSNLLRRLTKRAPRGAWEPCPLTFHHAALPMPIARDQTGAPNVDLTILLPLADAALRALRRGDGVQRALDVEIERHLVLLALPCNDWADVRQAEQYVQERARFAGPPDPRCIGVFFSGYRPDASSDEERVYAIKLGTVAGGWDSVYRAIVHTDLSPVWTSA